ncbi:MAG: hypothetical protein KKD05_05565 [Candidatus Omnitrophica bacterium]|nr:hypothetical protein [Candidatus Omnitrophota bacterium]
MKKILLAITAMLLLASVGYCQNDLPQQIKDGKELICGKEFNRVIERINKISHKYPALAEFIKNSLIQKEFVKDEGGMYYGLLFTNNFQFSMLKPKPIDEKRSYAGVNFSLRTGQYNGQADISSINEYLKRESPAIIQNRFKSGIVMFGQVVSDDEPLKNEIYNIFDEVIKELLQWEKAQVIEGENEQTEYPASGLASKAKSIAEDFMSKQYYKNAYEVKASPVQEFDGYVDCYFKRKIPIEVKGDGLVRVNKLTWEAKWIGSV